MPVTPTYPGVYIEEVPSGVHTIVGVATAITAFVGRAQRGPVNEPITIQNFADYERGFGGLWQPSTMSYAVQQYFQNGGGEALAIRIHRNATLSTASLSAGADTLDLESADEGSWGGNLQVTVDHDTEPVDPDRFNLTVEEVRPATPPADPQIVATETHRNLSMDPEHPRFVENVLRDSNLIRVDGTAPTDRPDEQGPVTFLVGSDGDVLDANAYLGSESQKTGLFALEKADLFNLLCIPPPEQGGDTDPSVWGAALPYCKRRRAMLIVDPPADWDRVSDARDKFDDLGLTRDENAALYFPRLKFADPLAENRLARLRARPRRGRRDGAHGCGTRRLEGTCRNRRDRAWRACADRAPDRWGAGPAQPARSERDPQPAGDRQRDLGGAHAARRRPARFRVEVRARPAGSRCSSRRASTAARSGRSSSPTTSPFGHRSG